MKNLTFCSLRISRFSVLFRGLAAIVQSRLYGCKNRLLAKRLDLETRRFQQASDSRTDSSSSTTKQMTRDSYKSPIVSWGLRGASRGATCSGQ
jgi:hypothetical protein